MEVTSCAVSTALAPYLTLLIRFRAEPFACEQLRLKLTDDQRETVRATTRLRDSERDLRSDVPNHKPGDGHTFAQESWRL